jgi:hypothetical protein
MKKRTAPDWQTEIKQRLLGEIRKIERVETRFANLVEMKCHVAHLDHYIAGQSSGAEPDERRRTDQRPQDNKSRSHTNW